MPSGLEVRELGGLSPFTRRVQFTTTILAELGGGGVAAFLITR